MNKPYMPETFPLNKEKINLEKILLLTSKSSQVLAEFRTRVERSRIPNFFPFLQTKLEAISSTKIEGTRATLDEILEFEIEEGQAGTIDVNEVNNYIAASEFAKRAVDDKEILTNKIVKNIHKILLSGDVRGKDKQPGEYRVLPCSVGGEYIPPQAMHIDNFMSNLERYINNAFDNNVSRLNIEFNNILPEIVKCAIIHAQFETIHPFSDGNGRVGRILIPTYLYFKKEIDNPTYFFLSKTLEQNKHKYYDKLNATRLDHENGWNEWIVFFLESVIKHCASQIEMINEVELLYEKCKAIINKKSNSNALVKSFNFVFRRIITNCKQLSNETGLANSTANAHLKKFVELKIIVPQDISRNRKYYFYDLLDILGKY